MVIFLYFCCYYKELIQYKFFLMGKNITALQFEVEKELINYIRLKDKFNYRKANNIKVS